MVEPENNPDTYQETALDKFVTTVRPSNVFLSTFGLAAALGIGAGLAAHFTQSPDVVMPFGFAAAALILVAGPLIPLNTNKNLVERLPFQLAFTPTISGMMISLGLTRIAEPGPIEPKLVDVIGTGIGIVAGTAAIFGYRRAAQKAAAEPAG